MNAEMIGAAILSNTHVNVNIPFQKVTPNTLCAFGVIGGLGYIASVIAKSGSKKQYAAGGFAVLAFACCYAVTKRIEMKETQIQNDHEKDVTRIKHPRPKKVSVNVESPNISGTFKGAQHNNSVSPGIKFLISDLIRMDGFTLIFGEKGSGKSILARQIGTSLSLGVPCAAFHNDSPSKPLKVILLDAELKKTDHVNRGYKANPNLVCFARDEFNYTSITETLKEIERLVKEANEDCVVILDCISSSKFGFSVSSPTDAVALNCGLQAIRENANARGYEVNFIGINHANKSDKDMMRGCSSLMQNATSIIQISQVEGHPDYRTIRVERNRSGAEGYEWTVLKIPPTESEELHYEIADFPTEISQKNEDIQSEEPTDENYAKYCVVKALVEYHKKQGHKSFWGTITEETEVTKQCFNTWKKKYGDAELNESDEDSMPDD